MSGISCTTDSVCGAVSYDANSGSVVGTRRSGRSGKMLGLAEGDVDMIRNFGTVIDDDAVRSLVLSTRLLGTREIMIINHTDCGMLRFTDSELEDRLRKETGQSPIAPAKFYSFTDAEANTKEQIQKARSHPWISPEVPVRGFVYDVHTGRLGEVFPDRETVAV